MSALVLVELVLVQYKEAHCLPHRALPWNIGLVEDASARCFGLGEETS